MIEIRKGEKREGKEIRKEKKEIIPLREKVVTDYNRDDITSILSLWISDQSPTQISANLHKASTVS